jgi:hypothetical protein
MRDRRHRLTPLTIAVLLASTTLVVGGTSAPAVGVAPTFVTIEWHDGNADQIGLLRILDDYPAIHVTFLVNTGPILDHDPAKLSVLDVKSLFEAGNEIA